MKNRNRGECEAQAVTGAGPRAVVPDSQHVLRRHQREMGCWNTFITVVIGCLLLSGCTPPGPRALLSGKKLLEQGKYSRAIEKLNGAAALLPNNAQVWNYLGLACHYAGRSDEAERSYRRALALDHDLTEAHYNLACLLLAQNQPDKTDLARTELLAYTLRRANAVDGLLKLGLAQSRSREYIGAEKSFYEALRLRPQNPEALNGLGLVRLQRGRPEEAVGYFRNALKQQPDYRPAMLNLAIVSHQNLKDRPQALQQYRAYAALKPAPPEAQTLLVLASQLEQELKPVPRPMPTNPVPPIVSNPVVTKPVVTNAARIASAPKSPVATNPPKPAPAVVVPPPANVQTVNLAAEPVFQPAQDVPSRPAETKVAAADPVVQNTVQSSNEPAAGARSRGLLQRINPMNLFRGDEKRAPKPTPLPPATETPPPDLLNSRLADGSSATPRYAYRSPPKPVAGDRAEAQRSFDQGVQAYRAHDLAAAIQAYNRATQLDPSFYEAYYNLGLTTAEAGKLPAALGAYESALAARPDSLDARYNFALELKQGHYILDAATELEKLLQTYPKDGRANLALGNLYLQDLHQPDKAREYYLKVLENDPQNPQASAIRYWLAANPP